jgi:threonine synthase
MLYVTTRNEHNAYTAHRAIHTPKGTDGGEFVPFRMPEFTSEEIAALQEKSFGQCVADMLNRFFSCGITGWDVEFVAGRHAAKLKALPHRVMVAELWHNVDGSYDHLEAALARRIIDSGDAPNSWVRIVIRLSVLAGLYGMMLREGYITNNQVFDVAVPTGDFTMAMSVWYLRRMGFPVANIICCCNDNSAVWDLMRHGEMKTVSMVKHTVTPLVDSNIPAQLERLISAALGTKEACRYHEVCNDGKVYAPPVGTLETLRKGIQASVVSDQRICSDIPNVYRTGAYLMGPYTALAYGGLMDYRSVSGLSRPALLLADRSVLCDAAFVCKLMDCSVAGLNDMIR